MKYIIIFLFQTYVFAEMCPNQEFIPLIKKELENSSQALFDIIDKKSSSIKERLINELSKKNAKISYNRHCGVALLNEEDIKKYLNNINETKDSSINDILFDANIPFLLSTGSILSNDIFESTFKNTKSFFHDGTKALTKKIEDEFIDMYIRTVEMPKHMIQDDISKRVNSNADLYLQELSDDQFRVNELRTGMRKTAVKQSVKAAEVEKAFLGDIAHANNNLLRKKQLVKYSSKFSLDLQMRILYKKYSKKLNLRSIEDAKKLIQSYPNDISDQASKIIVKIQNDPVFFKKDAFKILKEQLLSGKEPKVMIYNYKWQNSIPHFNKVIKGFRDYIQTSMGMRNPSFEDLYVLSGEVLGTSEEAVLNTRRNSIRTSYRKDIYPNIKALQQRLTKVPSIPLKGLMASVFGNAALKKLFLIADVATVLTLNDFGYMSSCPGMKKKLEAEMIPLLMGDLSESSKILCKQTDRRFWPQNCKISVFLNEKIGHGKSKTSFSVKKREIKNQAIADQLYEVIKSKLIEDIAYSKYGECRTMDYPENKVMNDHPVRIDIFPVQSN